MIQTATMTTHRLTIKTAAHMRAQNERSNKEARRTASILRIAGETGRIWLCDRRALRRELLTFRLRNHPTTLVEGTYLIRAISKTTGEIRDYNTRFLENRKFIGNADYVLNNADPTIYQTYVRTGANATSWNLIDTRETAS